MKKMLTSLVLLLLLVLPLGALADVVLPSNLTTIEAEAFLNDTSLTGTLTLPEGVTAIGKSAFSGCTGLTEIILPASVKSIGAQAFSGCTGLTGTLVIGKDVTVAEDAFAGCDNLTVTILPDATPAEYFTYTIENGEVTITGLATDISGEAVVIPDTIEGCPVTAIADDVFKSCHAASINIPASVTSIGQTVFYASYSLTEINVAANNPAYKSVDGVLMTKDGSMLVCCPAAYPAATYVIPDTVTSLDIYAFAYCSGLTEVILSDALTEISERAFFYCRSMPSITIPDSVTAIGTDAFAYCEALTEIDLPASVQSIGNGAFDCCTNLATVSIPSTLTSLGSFVFSGCTNLTDIFVDEGNPYYASHDGILMSKDGATLMIHPAGRTYTSFTVPDTVTYLDGGAFSGCVNLESITLPDTLTYLTNFVFSNCTGLKSINIPASITGIHVYAFNGTRGFTATVEAGSYGESWAIEKGIPYVLSSSDPDDDDTTPAESFTYTIENGEVTITGLNDGVELTEIVIPDTIEDCPVTAIGFEAFMGNETLTSVTLPEGLKLIDSWAFQACRSLANINLPSTLTTINNCAFVGCSSLTSLTIPEGMTEISDGVFSSCSALTTLKLPSTLKTISAEAFSNCALTSVTIPEGVTKIGTHAFSFNESLSYVKIPSTMTDMDGESFSFCSSLSSLDIAADHPVYSIQNGLIIRKDTKTVTGHLDSYSSVSTDIVVPEGIEVIGTCALRYCDWATSVSLPSTLKRIEDIAFGFDDGTNGITSLTIPESVEHIGYWAFANWRNLTELNISPDISYIDSCAFAHCTSLTGTLEFGDKALIHAEAFAGCDDLTVTVKVAEGDTPASMFGFLTNDSGVTITSYRNPLGYTDIIIPATMYGMPVTAIGPSAFESCPSLTSIVIPEGVTTIGNFAFASCGELTSVTLPSTLTSVGYGIINNSSKVTAIHIAADHSYLSFSDGMLCEKANQRLIAMIIPSGTTQLIIPGTVKIIGTRSINAQGVTNLTLSEGVTTIESYGIRYAYNLTALNVPSTLMELQSNAISGAYNLRTTLTLPNGATVAENAFPDSRVTITYAPDPDADTPANYFHYQELETSVIIHGYRGPDTITTVRIPAEINGKPVTAIDGSFMFFTYPNVTDVYIPEGVTTLSNECFRESKGLENIYLPSTLTAIGDSCFVWCDKLQSIEIPDSVTSFGSNIFGECSSMTTCKLPKGLKTLPFWTFGNCTGLETLTLPDGLEKIDMWAFHGAALDTLVLPDSVTTLAEEALSWAGIRHITLSSSLTEIPQKTFETCNVLEDIAVPEGVTSIGDQAFSNCYQLKSISLPSSLTSIGAGAFNSCHSLTDVSIHEDNPVFAISNGALLNGTTGDMLMLITGIAEDGSYTVGSDVKSIGANVFANNSDLKSIVIPEGVTSIGERAFSWCTELTSVSLPSTVTSIAENAFEACSALSTITVAEGNEHYSITDSMLISADKTLLVPIGGLTASSFTVPEGIVRIGNSAFRNAFELSSISLPSTLTSIGDYAFNNAGINTGISSFIMPDTVTSIGEYAFFNASISTIHLSSGLTDIPRDAFEFSRLTEVVLPDSIRSVGQYAFGSCESLTSITLNDGLTTLGFGAFAYCPNVQEIYIPASVTSIDNWAFGVTQDNATFIVHRGTEGETFCKNNWLSYVYDASDCTPVDQLTYTATETAVTITGYTGTDTEVILPVEIEGLPVTAIGDSAFAGSAITAISLPASLESVGAYAFDSCSALVGLTLPDGLLSIGDYAFRGCTALEYGILHIPGSVQTIGALIADKDCILLSIVPGTPGETYAMENGYNWGC